MIFNNGGGNGSNPKGNAALHLLNAFAALAGVGAPAQRRPAPARRLGNAPAPRRPCNCTGKRK